MVDAGQLSSDSGFAQDHSWVPRRIEYGRPVHQEGPLRQVLRQESQSSCCSSPGKFKALEDFQKLFQNTRSVIARGENPLP